ncbi:unnamed protein product [Vicia faba]|uniref:Uncharacterized protein n=1 Tax=Vicia faba TaxID=3906 RepID=A0AAV1AYB7_VICFA|nr:unnamed protein product [Vicia faba]
MGLVEAKSGAGHGAGRRTTNAVIEKKPRNANGRRWIPSSLLVGVVVMVMCVGSLQRNYEDKVADSILLSMRKIHEDVKQRKFREIFEHFWDYEGLAEIVVECVADKIVLNGGL